jgi:hypothetical protein
MKHAMHIYINPAKGLATLKMGRKRGMLSNLQNRVDRFFYNCEYLKECDKTTPQCSHGGNSYCGEYKKRGNKKN